MVHATQAIECVIPVNETNPIVNSDNIDKQVCITMPVETVNVDSCNRVLGEEGQAELSLSDNMKKSGRLAVLALTIVLLLVGRYSVPDNEVKGVQDKLMDALESANSFINAAGNELFRDFFQSLCSLMVDAVFLSTFGYWVIKGTNGRLPLTLAIFYITRALVQKLWFSPFPEGYYWENPGIPSLVVPYGRGSDFFFSGHTGFLVICASEWHRLNFPRMRNFTIVALIYTVLVLLTYRIHYTIDIFTGLFFAEWCFGKVDSRINAVDGFFAAHFSKLRAVLGPKNGHMLFLGSEVASVNKIEEKQTV